MKIALIEDEKEIAELLKEGVEMEGFLVDIYPDAESFHKARAAGYRLVIVDIMLPGKDGFSVCRTLREQEDMVPILMLTARDSVEDKVRALDAGADDYLVKPFSLDELFARTRALTRRGGSQGPVLSGHGVVLDKGSHTVTCEGSEVALTTKEFDILALLMEHPGKAMSRDAIADAMWPDDALTESNVVDVHVSKLRKKLQDKMNDHETPITTIRGIGYSFTR